MLVSEVGTIAGIRKYKLKKSQFIRHYFGWFFGFDLGVTQVALRITSGSVFRNPSWQFQALCSGIFPAWLGELYGMSETQLGSAACKANVQPAVLSLWPPDCFCMDFWPCLCKSELL